MNEHSKHSIQTGFVFVMWCFIASGAAPISGSSDLRLIEAVEQQDSARAIALIDQRVDVNAATPDGATALHWAVHWDDARLVDRLIAAKANVNVANELGVTPLSMACENGNGALVIKILRAGANANASSNMRPPALLACARTGSVEGVTALLAGGANVNAAEPRHQQTALMWSVAERHPEVVRLLLTAHADVAARSRLTSLRVNRADPNDIYTGVVGDVSRGSSTALLFAARSGDAASARLLLQAGANANDVAPDGNSALVVAVHSDQQAVAEVLLEHGANPNAVGGGYSALHAAVLRGNLSLVHALVARGARVDSQVRNGTTTTRATRDYFIPQNFIGATPLLLAARYLEIDIMRALVLKGADARIPTKDGTTLLMAAAGVPAPPQARLFDRRGRLALIRNSDEARALDAVTMAVEVGGGDVNAANSAGDTALHGAAAENYPVVARFLIDRGARVNVHNGAGKTPLAVATGEKVSAVLQKAALKIE